MTSERLAVSTFDIPIPEIRIGYRSAVYFNRSKKILEAELPQRKVLMQVFQKNNAVLCGIDEALAILKIGTGHWSNPDKAERLFEDYVSLKTGLRANRFQDPTLYQHNLTNMVSIEVELDQLWISDHEALDIRALNDGDEIEPWESVMHISGALSSFVHLESIYLGVLARRTKVATNTRRVCEAANGKPVLFFADRFDHYATQGGDGYAAAIGGAQGVASDAMAAWWGEKGLGTMPHALIAAYNGDVVEATRAFQEHVPGVNLIALVDFNNECVLDSVRCLERFGEDLWGVRLDTSETMVDRCITTWDMGEERPTGVNPILVDKVRKALDQAGGSHVKIIVSGGFNAEKITAFEKAGVPVDSYAVGSSLLSGSNDFTADVVQPVSKAGRRFRPNPRLQSA